MAARTDSSDPPRSFTQPRNMPSLWRFFVKMLLPPSWVGDDKGEPELKRYRQMWWYVTSLTLLVSLTPLVIMSELNHFLYQRALRSEARYDISDDLHNIARSLDFVIEERLSALEFISDNTSMDELSNTENLAEILRDLKSSFGGFVDLSIINQGGVQQYYAGPYNLQGDVYEDQAWFREVAVRGVNVSEVFMGHRRLPHFVISIRKEVGKNSYAVLRATVDMGLIIDLMFIPNMGHQDDAFLVTREGILQTPSLHHGKILEPCSRSVPQLSADNELIEENLASDGRYVMGYRAIPRTPFILVVRKGSLVGSQQWQRARTERISILLTSAFVILLVVPWLSTYMVRRIRIAELRRADTLHRMEFTAKMATIGRLAASVAHEINNPLAIINEKAGLMKDIIEPDQEYPRREKMLKTLDSVTRSVERCSTVTHRLLGFTRSVKSSLEIIDLPHLLQEVLSFTGKEALHRNLTIHGDFGEQTPSITSDRSKLEQIFLNIVNNAFAAVSDGGRINLSTREVGPGWVGVTISDDGEGIEEEMLAHVFEPFFSTKGGFGTGLGLSITYELVQQLGGRIEIDSKIGKGTKVTVVLPTSPASER